MQVLPSDLLRNATLNMLMFYRENLKGEKADFTLIDLIPIEAMAYQCLPVFDSGVYMAREIMHVPPIVLPDAQQRKPALAKNKKTNRAMQGGLSVTPNPSDQWVAFEVSELEGLNAQSSIQVYNSAGAVLETITLRKGAGQYILDTRRFESGIYFYRLMGAKESFSGKFIIQH
jgi:hypothetical protein